MLTSALIPAIASPLISGWSRKSSVDPLLKAVRAAFANGERGFVYDNNDLTAMFRDFSSTTAVPNEAVALQLDKHKGLAEGANVRTSGALFLQGTAAAATFNDSTGVGSVTRVDGSNQSYRRYDGLLPNTLYKLTFSAISGSLSLRTGTYSNAAFSQPSTPGVHWCLSSATGAIAITSTGPATITYTLDSIKAVPGYHSHQTIPASRAILRGTPVNPPVFYDDFSSSAGWSLGSGWSIAGGKLTRVSSGSGGAVADKAFASEYNRVYRVRIAVDSITPGSANVSVRLSGGTQVIGPSLTTPGLKEFWMIGNGTNTTMRIAATNFDLECAIDYIQIDDVSADVVTAPYGLQYDNVDDFYNIATMDLTGTSKITLMWGARRPDTAVVANGLLIESSTQSATNNGAIRIVQNGGSASCWEVGIRGTTAQSQYRQLITGPSTNVLFIRADLSVVSGSLADQLSLEVDGNPVTIVAAGTTGGTTFGNYPWYRGRRAGTTQQAGGLDFGGVLLSRHPTAQEAIDLKAFGANRTHGT